MPLDPNRISQDIKAIAGFNRADPAIGYSRPTFSMSWQQARDYVIAQAQSAGCKSRIDAAGNVHIRPTQIDWSGHIWLSGSHIDSVPTGGKFDGVAGIICPLEVLRSAHESDQTIPLELIIFAEEEGTTFGLGMIGSRLWTGEATPESIQTFHNAEGQNFLEAGASHGVKADELSNDRFNPSHYRGLIEIHIEQGPAMWETNVPIAVVSAISGRKQYLVELKGVPNHAGSTPMKYRSDALVAAARLITDIEQMAINISTNAVATVGRIKCEPNAINVIPGSVSLTIDLRSPDAQELAEGHYKIDQIIRECGADEASFVVTEDQPVVRMDAELVSRLQTCAGPHVPLTISGALHDAAILAPHLPTAMIFVASKDGISHNPVEFSRIDDLAEAAKILETLVRDS